MQFFTDFATVCEHAKVLLLPAEHVPTKKREMYKYLTTLITNTRWNEFVDGWPVTWRFSRIISLSKWNLGYDVLSLFMQSYGTQMGKLQRS